MTPHFLHNPSSDYFSFNMKYESRKQHPDCRHFLHEASTLQPSSTIILWSVLYRSTKFFPNWHQIPQATCFTCKHQSSTSQYSTSWNCQSDLQWCFAWHRCLHNRVWTWTCQVHSPLTSVTAPHMNTSATQCVVYMLHTSHSAQS